MPILPIAISLLWLPCPLTPGENANRAHTVFTIVALCSGWDFEGSLRAGSSGIHLQLDRRTYIEVSVPGFSGF